MSAFLCENSHYKFISLFMNKIIRRSNNLVKESFNEV
jgi:hypothetical protein